MSQFEAPRITIYYRILNNIDESPISDYVLIPKLKDMSLNYGDINAVYGGESPFIIEFDIWNNEPAFSGGMLPSRVEDAVNCKFSVWNDDTLSKSTNIRYGENQSDSYVYARCITGSSETNFEPIAGAKKLSANNIFGNINKELPGVLSGQPGGDHTIIQTKVIIPPDTNYSEDFSFIFNFEYDYI